MSASAKVRGLVLAAGEGRRLRPLTTELPKPLLPVAGRPVAAWALDALRAAGAEEIALNLCHRGDRIRRALGDSWHGVPLRYSEEPELLGTLGALGPLREFWRDVDELVLVNGDSLCRWPLRRLLRRHRRRGAAATLLLSARADAQEYGGGVGVARDGRVVALRDTHRGPAPARRLVFAGAHVLGRELLSRLPELVGPADVVGDLYQPRLADGAHLATLSHGGAWHDLGTPARYLRAALEWSAGPLARRRRLHRRAGIEAGARIRRSVVGAGAAVGVGARVDRSVILGDAVVGPGCRLRRVIVGPGAELPESTSLEGCMVTPLRHGRSPFDDDSVFGQMVIRPLGGS